MTSAAWMFLGCIWTTIFVTIGISMRKIVKLYKSQFDEQSKVLGTLRAHFYTLLSEVFVYPA